MTPNRELHKSPNAFPCSTSHDGSIDLQYILWLTHRGTMHGSDVWGSDFWISMFSTFGKSGSQSPSDLGIRLSGSVSLPTSNVGPKNGVISLERWIKIKLRDYKTRLNVKMSLEMCKKWNRSNNKWINSFEIWWNMSFSKVLKIRVAFNSLMILWCLFDENVEKSI